jgi:hypothetical protein
MLTRANDTWSVISVNNERVLPIVMRMNQSFIQIQNQYLPTYHHCRQRKRREEEGEMSDRERYQNGDKEKGGRLKSEIE